MQQTFHPSGVCSRNIRFTLKDGIVSGVSFEGGCSGNSQGIARLVEGMEVGQAIEKLSGIRCGMKSTSCPDQLARALAQANE